MLYLQQQAESKYANRFTLPLKESLPPPCPHPPTHPPFALVFRTTSDVLHGG